MYGPIEWCHDLCGVMYAGMRTSLSLDTYWPLPWVRCQAAPAVSIGDTLVTVGGKNVYGLSLTTLRLLEHPRVPML